MLSDKELLSSHPTQIGIPSEWQEKYIVKRIDADDIEVSLEERNGLLKVLATGQRYVQIRKFTLMVANIRSIDPKYPPDNIPPRPTRQTEVEIVDGVAVETVKNQEILELWDSLFTNNEKLLEKGEGGKI